MKLRYMPVALILLLIPVLVSAELYRYTDERGVIHFTDNYIEIPENQRPKVEIVNRPEETAAPEVQTAPAGTNEPQAEQGAGEVSTGETGDQGSEAAAEAAQPQPQFDSLIKAKADLDKLYDALATEKEALEKEQKTLKTVESIRAFQSKVNQFNQRLADYEKKRQAFQTQADAYNKTVAR